MQHSCALICRNSSHTYSSLPLEFVSNAFGFNYTRAFAIVTPVYEPSDTARRESSSIQMTPISNLRNSSNTMLLRVTFVETMDPNEKGCP